MIDFLNCIHMAITAEIPSLLYLIQYLVQRFQVEL